MRRRELSVATRAAYTVNGERVPAGTVAILRPASRSGEWKLTPRDWTDWRGRRPILDVMPAHRAAREYPEHAAAILGRPDTTD